MKNGKIDFVIAWVDGNDPNWQKEKLKYQNVTGEDTLAKWNDGAERYRDWDILKYWFRGVEKFAPWVRKIHFVTWGHLPEWLNVENPKLNIVNHKDYIPEEYLPTFNSHCIELNLHRIKGLSERFVYFNDDMFLTAPVKEKDFFKNGLPCDTAIVNPVQMIQNGIRAEINNLYVINDKFSKHAVIKQAPANWFSPKYGKELIRTVLMMPFNTFPGFLISHLPGSYTKQTFQEVWEANENILKESCRSKIRKTTDVNQWLMQYWQFATNRFYPRSPRFGVMYEGEEHIDDMCEAIRNEKIKIVCCNDSVDIENFEKAKKKLQHAFMEILPKKSTFEL